MTKDPESGGSRVLVTQLLVRAPETYHVVDETVKALASVSPMAYDSWVGQSGVGKERGRGRRNRSGSPTALRRRLADRAASTPRSLGGPSASPSHQTQSNTKELGRLTLLT